MIRSFKDRDAEQLFLRERVAPRLRQFWRVAQRKLEMLDAATELNDIKVPPGNRLEALKGDRKGQHSIRINDQFRVCFVWRKNDAYDVQIVDYHR